MTIRYVGEIYNTSGYAEAVRMNIVMLLRMGYEVYITHAYKIENKPLDDWKSQYIHKNAKINDEIDCDITIYHLCPPTLITEAQEKNEFRFFDNTKRVFYLAWEADLLPGFWVESINKYGDAIITICEQHKEVFKNSGIEIPIYDMGPTLYEEDLTKEVLQSDVDKLRSIGVDKDKYTFYSIFMWIGRKNPEALIHAFTSAFNKYDDVQLLLKVHYGTSDDKKFIANDIKRMILEARTSYPPNILLITEKVSDSMINAIHHVGDCYVSPHRGEATGLGILDAAIRNKPIITTGYAGPEEFLDENSHLLNYEMKSIINDYRLPTFFNSYMKWAEPDMAELRNTMREVYFNQEKNTHTGERAKNKYSYENNSKIFKRILEEVNKGK